MPAVVMPAVFEKLFIPNLFINSFLIAEKVDSKTIHTTLPHNCILSYSLINLYIPFLIPIKKPQNQVGCEQPTAFTIFG